MAVYSTPLIYIAMQTWELGLTPAVPRPESRELTLMEAAGVATRSTR